MCVFKGYNRIYNQLTVRNWNNWNDFTLWVTGMMANEGKSSQNDVIWCNQFDPSRFSLATWLSTTSYRIDYLLYWWAKRRFAWGRNMFQEWPEHVKTDDERTVHRTVLFHIDEMMCNVQWVPRNGANLQLKGCSPSKQPRGSLMGSWHYWVIMALPILRLERGS